MTTAILLIAHGSRQAQANADLHFMVEELRRRGDYAIVEPAFLELAEPTIEQGGKRCVDLGVNRVILLPYFLSAGIHVGKDLEMHRDRLAENFPQVTFHLGEPLGRHPLLVDVLVQRAMECSRHAPRDDLSSRGA